MRIKDLRIVVHDSIPIFRIGEREPNGVFVVSSFGNASLMNARSPAQVLTGPAMLPIPEIVFKHMEKGVFEPLFIWCRVNGYVLPGEIRHLNDYMKIEWYFQGEKLPTVNPKQRNLPHE